MDELLNFVTKELSIGDFLVVHKDCEIKTVFLGIIVGGLRATTIKPGYEKRVYELRCVTHKVSSEESVDEFPVS